MCLQSLTVQINLELQNSGRLIYSVEGAKGLNTTVCLPAGAWEGYREWGILAGQAMLFVMRRGGWRIYTEGMGSILSILTSDRPEDTLSVSDERMMLLWRPQIQPHVGEKISMCIKSFKPSNRYGAKSANSHKKA